MSRLAQIVAKLQAAREALPVLAGARYGELLAAARRALSREPRVDGANELLRALRIIQRDQPAELVQMALLVAAVEDPDDRARDICGLIDSVEVSGE